MTTVDRHFTGMEAVHTNGWNSWLWKQGPWVVLSIAALYVIDVQFLMPMSEELREQSKEARANAKTLTKAVEDGTQNQSALISIQKQQADSLDKLSRNQEETNRIQRQLLDATQRGVWMDKHGKAQ
jgi:hypothetical protein